MPPGSATHTRSVLVGISFLFLLLLLLVFLLKFFFVATLYGVLANVTVDYFSPICRHGNKALLHVNAYFP